MNPNVRIIRETLEQVVNQKRIEAWDDYFSPDYIARGAPFMGLGCSLDDSGSRPVINYITPGGPADRHLRKGDEIVWVEDDRQRWESPEEVTKGFQSYHGSTLKMGILRGEQTLEIELSRSLMQGYDTNNDQAKVEILEFMTEQIPDLTVEILHTIAEGDRVACFMEYRGTHARFARKAAWREAWFTRLCNGKIVESWPLPDISAYCRQLGYRLTSPDA